MSTNFILQNDNMRPRDEVRIESLTASPYPDGRRVHVEITVTPFRERPNLDITIISGDGQPVAATSAIEIMGFRVSFNLHLRGIDQPAGEYTVRVLLYYEDLDQPQDRRDVALHIPPATSPPGNEPG
ncbi:MAG: hypothetical protein EHM39_00870 [Chloroflexi bacterium]|nr:MAG: hypothetical protein EHM39_00870 [Chloroflexota bacterium]